MARAPMRIQGGPSPDTRQRCIVLVLTPRYLDSSCSSKYSSAFTAPPLLMAGGIRARGRTRPSGNIDAPEELRLARNSHARDRPGPSSQVHGRLRPRRIHREISSLTLRGACNRDRIGSRDLCPARVEGGSHRTRSTHKNVDDKGVCQRKRRARVRIFFRAAASLVRLARFRSQARGRVRPMSLELAPVRRRNRGADTLPPLLSASPLDGQEVYPRRSS